MELKRVLMLSREFGQIAGAGGVKDVVKGLSLALVKHQIETYVVLPRYGFIRPEELGFERMDLQFKVNMNYAAEERTEDVSFWQRDFEGVRLYLVESQRFGEKNGIYTYTELDQKNDPSKRAGDGHFDYFAMNVLHQKASLGLFSALGIVPDVIHCHDGHTGLVPATIKEIDGFRHFFLGSSCLLTIHNAGVGYHQEVGDLPFARAITDLPWRVIYHCMLNGMFDPLVAGACYGLVNTVSENYARELQETELDAITGWLGHALKDRGIVLEGITNGIDVSEYDPGSNSEALGLPCSFDSLSKDFQGKKQCKKKLLEMLSAGGAAMEFMAGAFKDITVTGSLEYRPDLPLFTVISRLSQQKGIDILVKVLEKPLEFDRPFNLVVLGQGIKEIEEALKGVATLSHNKGRVCVLSGYNRHLANQIYAAGDFFIIPSRYEPCGLTDFIAQLMGNIPIVRHTGGLVKVKDGVNGLVFHTEDPVDLAKAMVRAISIYAESPATLAQMQANAIDIILQNYTWDKVVKRYIDLYKRAMDLNG